ncbi:cysteine peptidase family C39 domain-containing protein [Aquiflexum sp. TKW24L]|uniref:vitamin K epoxide reductase family protein n=1 Tax=Aquiflexum sp. TKW24L TaxID=2942212 RepID=UPI0020C0CBF6|nr:vitamin K epoxide reductase family protein [Aquiflexum sp. TKW24L]MCL6258553.1 cysteine peptidase family C39 domain-containing protein [Aquiflexum sp. TKW24L]
MKNSYLVTRKLLELLEIPFTSHFLNDLIDSHPEQESLLSISDTLTKYKVDSLAIQIGEDKLDQIPLPSVVQMNGDSYPIFSCVSKVSEDKVTYLDEKGKISEISRKEFVTKWTGITLLIEKKENASEPGYEKRRKENLTYLSLIFLLGTVGILWLIGLLGSLDGNVSYLIGVWSLFFLKSAGLLISAVLLWTEIDKENAAIKEFCSGGKTVDCNTVLDSFSLGGSISLSSIAFAYFFSGVSLLMITSFSGSALQLLKTLSFASLVIVPISLYYQGVKIKKWCLLCLWISGVLILEFVSSQMLLTNLDPTGLMELSLFTFLSLASILIWLKLKPFLLSKGEKYRYKSKLAKFMSNREVFDFLASGSRKITSNPEGLGIFLKGESSKYHILKVCNPYCGPCAKTHPLLEELYEAGNIDLQILFLSGGNDEVKLNTVRHLMGVASKGDAAYTRKALDDWYLPNVKDYSVFASKYPLNGELKRQEDTVKKMEAWCEAEQITHTPTIFINGHELPESYTVEDLKYVLV